MMASKRVSLGSHFLSSRKKEDLRELFASFDKDRDGKISRAELEEMLRSGGIESSSLPSMLNNTPSHHNDGSLDFEEFAAFMRPTLSDPHRLTKKQQELREAFDAFDKDGDGVINATELQAMMEKLGDKLSLSESQDLISDVDLDKDGAVNFEEFAVMMGISLPTSKVARSVERKECHHKHHWFSVRRYFCSEK